MAQWRAFEYAVRFCQMRNWVLHWKMQLKMAWVLWEYYHVVPALPASCISLAREGHRNLSGNDASTFGSFLFEHVLGNGCIRNGSVNSDVQPKLGIGSIVNIRMVGRTNIAQQGQVTGHSCWPCTQSWRQVFKPLAQQIACLPCSSRFL